MKILFAKLLMVIGVLSIFQGISDHIIVHAKEASSGSSSGRCDSMGGRSGGCGKSG